MSYIIRYKTYRSTVTKTVWNWDKLDTQNNRTEKDSETDPHTCLSKGNTWLMAKVSLKCSELRMIILIHAAILNICPTGKKLDPYHTLYTKINFGWIRDKCVE